MSKCFVVKNHHGLYLNKQKEWVDGRENQQLFRSPHKDEAINMVFEMSSKDIYLRAEAISCEMNEKRNPIVEICTDLVQQPAAASPVLSDAQSDTDTDVFATSETPPENSQL